MIKMIGVVPNLVSRYLPIKSDITIGVATQHETFAKTNNGSCQMFVAESFSGMVRA